MCCSSWDCKESGMTEDWTENWICLTAFKMFAFLISSSNLSCALIWFTFILYVVWPVFGLWVYPFHKVLNFFEIFKIFILSIHCLSSWDPIYMYIILFNIVKHVTKLCSFFFFSFCYIFEWFLLLHIQVQWFFFFFSNMLYSVAQLCTTLRIHGLYVACQASLPREFSRQGYLSGVTFLPQYVVNPIYFLFQIFFLSRNSFCVFTIFFISILCS